LGDRSPGDTRSRLFMHRVDQYSFIIESEQPIGLVAMGQESSGDSLSNDERDNWVAGKPGTGIRVCCGSGGQMDPGDFFAPAVGLAFYIYDCDDRAFVV
jgi:hypothetical protein